MATAVVAQTQDPSQPHDDVKLFNRWTFEDVQDYGLMDKLEETEQGLVVLICFGPREDATRSGSAGVVRRQAIDISPLRRVNQALYLLTTSARESAFRNIKRIAECLANELINAAKGSSNSYAIKKKDETERVAKANRLRL
ncbi:Ribosomal S7 domain-containing protein [Citrus sinensis]|nr:Ribosomal S7 domain-containing protein [Citrus sinensis]